MIQKKPIHPYLLTGGYDLSRLHSGRHLPIPKRHKPSAGFDMVHALGIRACLACVRTAERRTRSFQFDSEDQDDIAVYDARKAEIVDKGWLLGGPKVQDFECCRDIGPDK